MSWAKQATLSIVAVPAVVNHLPPSSSSSSSPPPSLGLLSRSLCPALICTRRLIRARGPWWNFAVIVPNFSNIFYCLHHSFTGGRRRGACVSARVCVGGRGGGHADNYANDVAHFCRLLHSAAIVSENLIIKYYHAHVSFNSLQLCFNSVSLQLLVSLLWARIKADWQAEARQTPLGLMS